MLISVILNYNDRFYGLFSRNCKFTAVEATYYYMEEQSFLTHIKQHEGILHKICRLYRQRQEDREDLFQEMVFQLWKAWPTFKGDAKISTWMYRVALNTALSSFRKKQVPVSYPDALPDRSDSETDGAQSEKEAQLFALLNQLNDAEKAIITLYLEGLSYQQMAEITGVSENYIGVKLNRIKSKIQQRIHHGTR